MGTALGACVLLEKPHVQYHPISVTVMLLQASTRKMDGFSANVDSFISIFYFVCLVFFLCVSCLVLM